MNDTYSVAESLFSPTLARFEVAHHAHAHAAELTRRTGRSHFVYRIPQRDTTRPRALGVLVGVATA